MENTVMIDEETAKILKANFELNVSVGEFNTHDLKNMGFCVKKTGRATKTIHITAGRKHGEGDETSWSSLCRYDASQVNDAFVRFRGWLNYGLHDELKPKTKPVKVNLLAMFKEVPYGNELCLGEFKKCTDSNGVKWAHFLGDDPMSPEGLYKVAGFKAKARFINVGILEHRRVGWETVFLSTEAAWFQGDSTCFLRNNFNLKIEFNSGVVTASQLQELGFFLHCNGQSYNIAPEQKGSMSWDNWDGLSLVKKAETMSNFQEWLEVGMFKDHDPHLNLIITRHHKEVREALRWNNL